MSDKIFNLDLVDIPKIKRKNIDGKRFYFREDEEDHVYYPSVTTVLSSDKATKKYIHEWRRRVGEEKANSISRRASLRGTKSHKMIEDYVRGYNTTQSVERRLSATPLDNDLFGRLKQAADKYVNNIRCIEGALISHHLRVGGSVDMVAEFDGKLSVIDWKTALRAKKAGGIGNYCKQEAAYAVMFEETTGIPVPQLVTIISTEDGDLQIFVEKRDKWIDSFIQLREEFEIVSVHM